MSKVVISGGTGLIGRQLIKKLLEKGYEVHILSRSHESRSAIPVYEWDPVKGSIDEKALQSTDYIIHLAGTSLAGGRWTKEKKREIEDSRIRSGILLFEKTKQLNPGLKAFITASAVGYYGTITSEEIFTEETLPAPDFLGQTCKHWEEVADLFQQQGIRSVKIRTGIVLSRLGGALPKMILPIRFGLGAALGNGKQYMPWIHIDDLSGIFIKAMQDDQMNGAYNAVSPQPLNNLDFTKKIARQLKKPIWLPGIPALVLRWIFGEMAEILLKGSRISSEKIRKAGYRFLYPDLHTALNNLFPK